MAQNKGIVGGSKILLRGYTFLNAADFARLKVRAAANAVSISQQVRIDVQVANMNNLPVKETELQHYVNRLERRLRFISNTAARAVSK